MEELLRDAGFVRSQSEDIWLTRPEVSERLRPRRSPT